MKTAFQNYSIFDDDSNFSKKRTIKHKRFNPLNQHQNYSIMETVLVPVNNKLAQIFI